MGAMGENLKLLLENLKMCIDCLQQIAESTQKVNLSIEKTQLLEELLELTKQIAKLLEKNHKKTNMGKIKSFIRSKQFKNKTEQIKSKIEKLIQNLNEITSDDVLFDRNFLDQFDSINDDNSLMELFKIYKQVLFRNQKFSKDARKFLKNCEKIIKDNIKKYPLAIFSELHRIKYKQNQKETILLRLDVTNFEKVINSCDKYIKNFKWYEEKKCLCGLELEIIQQLILSSSGIVIFINISQPVQQQFRELIELYQDLIKIPKKHFKKRMGEWKSHLEKKKSKFLLHNVNYYDQLPKCIYKKKTNSNQSFLTKKEIIENFENKYLTENENYTSQNNIALSKNQNQNEKEIEKLKKEIVLLKLMKQDQGENYSINQVNKLNDLKRHFFGFLEQKYKNSNSTNENLPQLRELFNQIIQKKKRTIKDKVEFEKNKKNNKIKIFKNDSLFEYGIHCISSGDESPLENEDIITQVISFKKTHKRKNFNLNITCGSQSDDEGSGFEND
ncbi:hypothetical protein M0812_06422 [Anaeramoeba flamelloides]|uniref:Uncharacterized protein n=1 Tax=Anaeramoeba flamelloides TaxID=1746091 RepID=A0AAV8A8T5_9EUKA|nr:hypothetical protein M0812_06422 [Anaeramoeba flamelloides]